MSLYRACFLKRGKMSGQTFHAEDAPAAVRFAETVIEPLFKVEVLTVKPEESRIPWVKQRVLSL